MKKTRTQINKKIRQNEKFFTIILYSIGLFLYIFRCIILSSTFPFSNSSSNCFLFISFSFLFISFAFDFKITKSGLEKIFIFGIITALVCLCTKNLEPLYTFAIIMFSINISQKKLINIALFSYLVGIIFVYICSFLGIASTEIIKRGIDGTLRVNLGFSQINYAGRYLFVLAALILLKYKRVNWLTIIAPICLGCYLIFFVNSRSGGLCCLLLVFFELLSLMKHNIFHLSVIDYSFMVTFIVCLAFIFLFQNTEMFNALDKLLSSRPSWMVYYCKNYRLGLFGTYFPIILDAAGRRINMPFDNSYFYFLFHAGIVPTLFYIVYITWLAKAARINKNTNLQIVIFTFSIFFIVESTILILPENILLLIYLPFFLRTDNALAFSKKGATLKFRNLAQ